MIEQWNDLVTMLATKPLNAVFLILSILLLEVILSFDNAAVLATMVKDLPKEQQSKALRYGIVGAYVFRGIALVLVESILEIWWLKPLGGLYLIWMAFSFFSKSSASEAKETVSDTKKSIIYRSTVGLIGVFWSTVLAVEFMDIVFSIDNIFAVVSMSKNYFLICIGVFIGILAMRYVAKSFVVLMEKYAFLEKSAFIVIGILGLKLCFSMLVHYGNYNFDEGKIQIIDENKKIIKELVLADQELNSDGDLILNLSSILKNNRDYQLKLINVSSDLENFNFEKEDTFIFKIGDSKIKEKVKLHDSEINKNHINYSSNLTFVFKNNNKYKWIESEEFDLFISVLTLMIFVLPIVSVKFFKKK